MKFLFLLFFQITFTLLPQDEFQSLSDALTKLIPKSTNKKLKKVNVQFSQNPLQINLVKGDKQYALINEVHNKGNDFMQIKFIQQDPDLVIFKAMSKIITDENKLKNVKEIAKFIKEDLEYVITNHEQEEQQYTDKVKFVIEQFEQQLGTNKSKCETEINQQEQKSIYYCEDNLGTMLLLMTIVRIQNHILINAQFNKSTNEVYFTINTENDIIKEQLSSILENIKEIDFVQEDILQSTYQKLFDNMKPPGDANCDIVENKDLCNQESVEGKSCYFNRYCHQQDEQRRKLILKKQNQKPYKKIHIIENYDKKQLSQKIYFYDNKDRNLKEGEPLDKFESLMLNLIQYEFEHVPYIDIKYIYNDFVTAEYSIPYTNAEQFDKNIQKIIEDFKNYDKILLEAKKNMKEKKGEDEGVLTPTIMQNEFNEFFEKHPEIPNVGKVTCEHDPQHKEDDQDFEETFLYCLNENQDRIATGALTTQSMLFVFYITKILNGKKQTITENYWIDPQQKFKLDSVLNEAYEQYLEPTKKLVIIQFEKKQNFNQNKKKTNQYFE